MLLTKKIKKGDTVKVIAGKDRSKTGKVLELNPKSGRVLVEGLNLQVRHRRPRKTGEKGQKLVKPASITLSNLMVVCPNCGKAARIGFQESANGEKARICKNCERAI